MLFLHVLDLGLGLQRGAQGLAASEPLSELGRDVGEQSALANVALGVLQRALHKVAPTLASAGSHLTRLTTRGKHVPPELMDRVKELGRRYNSAQHDMPDSANRALIKELGLIDYLAERFAVIGSPRDCIAKLERAIDAGARQFWMSVHFDDKIEFMRQWSAQVMPAFSKQ